MSLSPLPLTTATQLLHQAAPGYTLTRFLASGAFGHIYHAQDALKQVAVKIIPLPSPGHDWSLITTQSHLLHHPSLVRLRDHFLCTLEGVSYGLALMDYWPQTLRSCGPRLRPDDFPRQRGVLRELAHQLHRLKEDLNLLATDLKPENVFVDRLDGPGMPRLVLGDYGGIRPAGQHRFRMEAANVHWAPELRRGDLDVVDETAVVYSYGLVAHHLLTGRMPAGEGASWPGDAPPEMAAWRRVVADCLAPREMRHPTFGHVTQALDAADQAWLARAPLSPEERPRAGQPWREPLTGMEFLPIPAGTGMLGRGAGEEAELRQRHGERFDARFGAEWPLTSARLSGFHMARFPVTRGQFARFVAETLYATTLERRGEGSWRQPGFAQGEDHPVVNVSWEDAMAFVAWLNRRTGLNFALPTEAQWEYACRAGTATPFHTGATIDVEQANDDGRAVFGSGGRAGRFRRRTTAVTRFPANAFGLHDMHGNVWEWCADGFDPGFRPEGQDPRCDHGVGFRMRRGGSWACSPSFLRSACRGRGYPDSAAADFGFRLVLEGIPG